MSNGKAALGAAVSVFAMSAAPALAQSDTAATAAGDRVYVYGRSLEATLPQELARYGSDLVSIGRDTITSNNYVDAHQALQMQIPGLYISPNGPFSYSDVSIQGSRIGDVLWLVDGVRINNRLYPGTLTDTIPANMIERIEVLKGGESLFYGTGAAGGVINIVTRDFSDTFGGELRAGADTNDSTSLSGMVRGPLGPGNFVLYGGWDQSDGIRAFSQSEPSLTMTHREYDVWNIGAKYGLDLTPSLRIVGQYQHTDGSIANVSATQIAHSANNRNEEIASLRIDYTPSDAAQFFLKTYYHDWDTSYDRVRNSVTAPGTTIVDFTDAYWGYEDYGVNALGKFRFTPQFETLLGYDYQRYSAVDDVWLIAPMEEDVHAVFGQIRTTEGLIENGSFAVGLRYNDTGGANATVWNVTGRYELTSTLYAQGGVSTNFLLPSAEQLFLNEPCCEAGNPNLEPEESINANLSLGGVTDQAYWQVTGFWREIDNIITADYDDPAFPNGVFVNGAGQVEVRGFEVLGGWSFTDALSAEASYTNTRAREEGTGIQFARIPREFAKASLNYDSGRFGGSLAARWNGDVYERVTGVPGRVNYGDYIVADISAFFYVDPDRKHQFSARLENVFDREYGRFGSDLLDSARAIGSSERFTYMTLAAPRTLHVGYRYSF
jgi:vitamin B12 transporter